MNTFCKKSYDLMLQGRRKDMWECAFLKMSNFPLCFNFIHEKLDSDYKMTINYLFFHKIKSKTEELFMIPADAMYTNLL